jgi:hypothetical protein
MNKSKSVMGFVLMLTALGASAGCGDMGMEGDGFGEAEADIASVEEAMGEVGCGLMACTSANSCKAVDITACGVRSVTLSTLPYGSLSCPRQYVVEDAAPPTTGGRIIPVFTWRGTTLTAANCASAKVELGLYKKLGAGNATLVGNQTYSGWWRNNFCTMVSTTATPLVMPSANLTAVRATVSATLGDAQQRAEIGLQQICP